MLEGAETVAGACGDEFPRTNCKLPAEARGMFEGIPSSINHLPKALLAEPLSCPPSILYPDTLTSESWPVIGIVSQRSPLQMYKYGIVWKKIEHFGLRWLTSRLSNGVATYERLFGRSPRGNQVVE